MERLTKKPAMTKKQIKLKHYCQKQQTKLQSCARRPNKSPMFESNNYDRQCYLVKCSSV